MSLSDFMVHQWHFFSLLVAAIITSGIYYFRTEKGIHLYETVQLKMSLIVKIMIARYCQTLGTLINSGVDMKSALEISQPVVVNKILMNDLSKMETEIKDGLKLSKAMKKSGYFPKYVISVVSTGEASGTVDGMLLNISERMQEEVDELLENFTALLQPMMIVVMGGVVAFIAISILLPMLNMNKLL